MPPKVRKRAECPGCGLERQIDGRGLCGACYRRVREAEDPDLVVKRLERDRARSKRYYEAHREAQIERNRRNYVLGVGGHHRYRPRKPKTVAVEPSKVVVCQECRGRWSDHGLCQIKLEHDQRVNPTG